MSHTSGNAENAKLLYHCGVAMRTDFGSAESGSVPDDAQWSLEHYFGFATGGVLNKSYYADNTWINMLKGDIDASRPIFYGGTDPVHGGHLWVVDGYNSSNQFHCNWGWSGQYNDTWYTLSSLSPGNLYNYPLLSQLAIFGISPILDACSGLSGNNLVCSSNSTYSVTIPATASVQWSKGANLTEVGANNTSNYTVHATSLVNGAISLVTATIKNSQGQTFLTRTKSVWAGLPTYPIVTSDNTYPYIWTTAYGEPAAKEYTIYTEQDIVFYDENKDTYGGLIENFDWTWYLDGGGLWYDEYNYGVGGKMYIFHAPGVFRVRASSENSCGATDLSAPVFVNVIQEEYSMYLSPNPATNETIISITTTNKKEDINTEWTLEVYDQSQQLKMKKAKLKDRAYTLNTTNWKDGVYIVRANYKGELLTEKLVVKKL